MRSPARVSPIARPPFLTSFIRWTFILRPVQCPLRNLPRGSRAVGRHPLSLIPQDHFSRMFNPCMRRYVDHLPPPAYRSILFPPFLRLPRSPCPNTPPPKPPQTGWHTQNPPPPPPPLPFQPPDPTCIVSWLIVRTSFPSPRQRHLLSFLPLRVKDSLVP